MSTDPDKELATTNPVGDAFNISVLVPEEITIRMVDASALADYEVWFFLASLLASSSVGFLVPYIQAKDTGAPIEGVLFWMAGVNIVLFIVAFAMALGKRAALRRKGRTMKLKTSLER